jgi:hypothetical protein
MHPGSSFDLAAIILIAGTTAEMSEEPSRIVPCTKIISYSFGLSRKSSTQCRQKKWRPKGRHFLIHAINQLKGWLAYLRYHQQQ